MLDTEPTADDSNDQSDAGAGSGAGLPNAPGIDIVAVSLASDDSHDVTFAVEVADLADQPGGDHSGRRPAAWRRRGPGLYPGGIPQPEPPR
mgnify:CR=1 FL=1